MEDLYKDGEFDPHDAPLYRSECNPQAKAFVKDYLELEKKHGLRFYAIDAGCVIVIATDEQDGISPFSLASVAFKDGVEFVDYYEEEG
jgi:hypothetical protein